MISQRIVGRIHGAIVAATVGAIVAPTGCSDDRSVTLHVCYAAIHCRGALHSWLTYEVGAIVNNTIKLKLKLV